jgi:hypothetical protein
MKKLAVLLCSIGLMLSIDCNAESVWDNPTETLEKPVDIVVYRSPTCGCCGKWLQHLEKHQFKVQDIVTDDMDSIKTNYGVPKNLASCHTAIVNGYIIEGHVPAADIKALLKNKPPLAGISVPGMTTGTPGMEMGDRIDPFSVIGFDKDGKTQIINSYGNR